MTLERRRRGRAGRYGARTGQRRRGEGVESRWHARLLRKAGGIEDWGEVALGTESRNAGEGRRASVRRRRMWEASVSAGGLGLTSVQGPIDNLLAHLADPVHYNVFSPCRHSRTDTMFLPRRFEGITGNNVLEKSDLQPVLKALKDRLMSKNVAEEIAEKLCESIAASLESKKQGFFTRISSTVQTAMEEALLHILTPRHSIDILKDVHAAEECGRPYVIVFVAYWLLQHNLTVTLAACDTFRSGAVDYELMHGG
ncbi:hypothetical protein U9M48_028514 [Paspalum notatum var. saurae]|uniref:Signal recognition particle SRP54 helical bundle domain-containing protein n=1 Tax=Paspalum notatum var. saurae TaxID=547442 RepID=A0AAQ3TZI4_PASNO